MVSSYNHFLLLNYFLCCRISYLRWMNLQCDDMMQSAHSIHASLQLGVRIPTLRKCIFDDLPQCRYMQARHLQSAHAECVGACAQRCAGVPSRVCLSLVPLCCLGQVPAPPCDPDPDNLLEIFICFPRFVFQS